MTKKIQNVRSCSSFLPQLTAILSTQWHSQRLMHFQQILHQNSLQKYCEDQWPQKFLLAFKLALNFPTLFRQNISFSLLKVKFPDFSQTLKKFFPPDMLQPCKFNANHAFCIVLMLFCKPYFMSDFPKTLTSLQASLTSSVVRTCFPYFSSSKTIWRKKR